MTRLIIFAPNVGSGGGLVLLRAMLKAWPADRPMIAILDERGRDALALEDICFDVHWVTSSFRGRWKAERLLASLARVDDTIFCFHNLPPILVKRGRVLCYLHNPNLVGLVPTSHLTGWVRIRYAIERFIARTFQSKIDRYMVQTPTMVAALQHWLGEKKTPIELLPFVDPAMMPARISSSVGDTRSLGDIRNPASIDWDFLYVSDGVTHKNHPKLFDAWVLLAEEGIFPRLALTLHPERDVPLRSKVRELVADKGVDIVDLGQVPHREILNAYSRTRALLFASYAESFGIPMIEAQSAGLPILAAEMDFVRDVCEPVVTFDPHSAHSIARAVKRFLYGTPSAVTLLSPEEFVTALLERADDASRRLDRTDIRMTSL